MSEEHRCGVRGFSPAYGDRCPACEAPAVPARSALDRAKDGLVLRERIRADANPRRYYENALVVDNGEKGSAQKTNIGLCFDWDDLSALVLDHENARAELVAARQQLAIETKAALDCNDALRQARHELALIEDRVGDNGRTDCSTPTFIRIENVMLELAAARQRIAKLEATLRDRCDGCPLADDRAAQEVGRG